MSAARIHQLRWARFAGVAVLLVAAGFVLIAALAWDAATPPAAITPSMPNERSGDHRAAQLDVADVDVAIKTTSDAPRPVDSQPEPTPAPASHPALPPTDAPLVEIFDELDRRARAGDDAAACRLGATLDYCTGWAYSERYALHYRPPTPGQDSKPEVVERYVEREAERMASADAAHQVCDGAPESRLLDGPAYFAMAAERGHTPSGIAFLNVLTMHPGSLIEHPELTATFRDRAWPFLRAGLAEGDFRALLLFASATSAASVDPLRRRLPERYRDREVGEALRFLLQNSGGLTGMVASLGPTAQAGPSQLAQAQTWLDELVPGGMPPALELGISERSVGFHPEDHCGKTTP